jgi:hypothetical protein
MSGESEAERSDDVRCDHAYRANDCLACYRRLLGAATDVLAAYDATGTQEEAARRRAEQRLGHALYLLRVAVEAKPL